MIHRIFGPEVGLFLFFAHSLLYQFINMAIKITFSMQLLKAFLIFLEAIESKIKAWRDFMFRVVLHTDSKTTVIWFLKWQKERARVLRFSFSTYDYYQLDSILCKGINSLRSHLQTLSHWIYQQKQTFAVFSFVLSFF